MGRFRNLSQSLKAAAFSSRGDHGSPTAAPNRRDDSPDDMIATKEVPALARETSANSVADTVQTRAVRSNSRPMSHMYTPPTMGKEDQIDELRPVFSYLSSHQNKLYQEGYFLKLNDLDTNGKPNADRNWTECFAQLVGTVLSLWDAAALDAAGQEGEVAPTFINLADASIKMIETLPTRNQSIEPLQNVLSVSTAGKNRYLLHFNSLHSLTQWTAGIRLAMFEHASLQELYTGSLIAGKGKFLNNIKTIMEKLRFVEEDWARVRFGAGTPWRRCWYVIQPPDEKEWQKQAKTMKKRGAYERPEFPRGDIKFYDTKKTKKATPVATICNVYSAYAVYPQSKPLINQSTLLKLEGTITIHSKPESKTEGFVFVMPELHPAVSGFEMLLRFLFPTFDTFALYGRPTRLIADTLDPRGLMFAMPKDRRYGYLDIIDVAGLIHTEGSDKWTEREWSKRMKELVSRRMTMATQGRTSNVEKGGRRSLGARPGIAYDDSPSVSSGNLTANQSSDMVFEAPKKTRTAPHVASAIPGYIGHTRSVSESVAASPPVRSQRHLPTRLNTNQSGHQSIESPNISPLPPSPAAYDRPYHNGASSEHDLASSSNSSSSELGQRVATEQVTHDLLPEPTPPAPVNQPYFQHQPGDRPQRRPMDRPELRREKSRMSNATLDQLVDASRKGSDAGAAATAAWRTNGRIDGQDRGVTSENPIKAENDANPFLQAIIPDLPSIAEAYPEGYIGTHDRPSYSRSTTQHSITRKPLPAYSQPATPTEFHSVPMTDRDSSPDYASTSKSQEQPLPAKKLGGIRKTIGDPNYAHIHKHSDIPEFDFGVTRSLTPGSSRPGSAGGRTSPLEGKLSSTPPRPNGGSSLQAGQVSPGYMSPLPSPHTPTGHRTMQTDRHSPGRVSPLPSPLSRPNSRHMWQPGMTTGRQSPGGLTAEEFVQQRAAMARMPSGYVPRRTASGNKIEEIVQPTQEQSKPKKLQKKSTSRPGSRGSTLDFSSSSLSAREQEHVARVTGGPLLNLSERKHIPDPDVGLIGAISAREQDKKYMKEGISSQLVQATIAQRQQQPQYAYPNNIQAQYRPGMNAWSQPPQNQYTSYGYNSQQFYQQPAQPNAYGQYQYQQPSGNQFYGGYYAPQGDYRRQ